MLPAEQAWLVCENLAGRTHKDIGAEIGVTAATVCNSIRKFCDDWSGVDVSAERFYNDERRKYELIALKKYFFQGGQISKPDYSNPAHGNCHYPSYVAAYYAARKEHAWLLRAEGLTYRAIGERMNICHESACQMVRYMGRRVSRAIRKVRWPNLQQEATL